MRAAPFSFVLSGLVVLAACSTPEGSARDAGRADLDAPIAPPRDARAPALDAPAPIDAGDPTLVPADRLATPRAIRGAWVPSVWNLLFPSRTGLTAAQARAEIVAILDVLQEIRANAVFVQIRPESDALYASSLEPWSRFLSGTQGTDPGYDPLAIWIEEAHARAIEVHAWMNPYRGMASRSAATAPSHPTRTLAAHAIPYGSYLWMDPGAEAVRDHVVAVVRDVVSRYAVDGVHFDDYFYPYPDASAGDFDDGETYDAYVASGGDLARDDWRRHNVHLLVEAVAGAIAAVRDDVRFGISPFGIYRPGMPPGIRGLDAYAAIYCDPLPWIENGWVDYLAPQLYWPTTRDAQDFDVLLAWWAERAHAGHTIVAGTNLVQLGTAAEWSLDEFRAQMRAVADAEPTRVSGSIAYTAQPFLEDRDGVRAAYRDEIWTSPAPTPPLASADRARAPVAPAIVREGETLRIDHPDRASLRAIALHADEGGAWSLRAVLPADATIVDAPVGAAARYAVSAIDRRGIESAGRLAP